MTAEPTAEDEQEAAATIAGVLDLLNANGFDWPDSSTVLDLWRRLWRLTDGYERTVRLPLLCGCGRRITTVAADAVDMTIPMVIPNTKKSNEAKPPANRDIRHAMAAPGYSNRWVLTCHPKKCGRQHVIRTDRLTEAFIRASEAGRAELIVGSGIRATEAGGPDL